MKETESVIPVYDISLSDEDIADRESLAIANVQHALEFAKAKRQAAYQRDADPIFMQYQRGEKTEQDWLDAVQAIKDANPYPVKAN